MKERKKLENKIKEIQNDIDNEKDIKKIRSYIGKVSDMLLDPNISVETKHKTMLLLVDKMIFNRDQKTLEIYFNKNFTKDN